MNKNIKTIVAAAGLLAAGITGVEAQNTYST